jgi:hypothetical protein
VNEYKSSLPSYQKNNKNFLRPKKSENENEEGSPNREPVGFLNRKNRTGIPVKPTGIPIGGY